MALYNTCDVSPLSKGGSLHRMLTLDTETSSMLISTVEAVRPKAISKLSAMFCNHSCMAICFYLCILAVVHTSAVLGLLVHVVIHSCIHV